MLSRDHFYILVEIDTQALCLSSLHFFLTWTFCLLVQLHLPSASLNPFTHLSTFCEILHEFIQSGGMVLLTIVFQFVELGVDSGWP